MQIDVNTLIAHYGYWALCIGCLADGETFTLLGGVAAHEGLLRYSGASLAAMCGGMLGDCALFFIGRHYGETILRRFQQHRQPVARA
ncbi:DedA family protein, partial [Erwinia amylovora]|uniref:DedA family protein n=1 Tax=Erwinia amylovora TaxID=552 RepID=UPI003855FC4A|nr:DedA family protein [Erwinia amylovora]